jgi:enamine deaminase RidA (YjgF/YER057c/UK114 family)
MKPSVLLLLAACAAPPRPAAPQVELFGRGLFTTDAWDFFLALAPDQARALFGRADDAFERYELLETRRDRAGGWAPPVRASFAADGSNADAHFTPDGRSVYFISNRASSRFDIYRADLRADGTWSDAVPVATPANDAATDKWSPAVAASGNLYFGAELPGTRGGSDLWVSRLVDGVYQPAENLGDAINTPAHEVEPWIAPDESYLIASALRRADSAGGYDLYVSRRAGDAWTALEPVHAVNTAANEWNHSVSPDGTWLYFTSNRRGPRGDMFRIPMEAVMTSPAYAPTYEVKHPERTLYISGQTPERPDGSVPETFEAQARQVWTNIDRLLGEAGLTRRDLVKVTTYLSDRKYRDDNARVRREVLGDHKPALTIIIAGIYDPSWLLEIEAIAAR